MNLNANKDSSNSAILYRTLKNNIKRYQVDRIIGASRAFNLLNKIQ